MFESSTTSEKQYNLNFNLNCLICNQPTRSFVDLFIRLPLATQNHKDIVAKLEHEFHTVSRRTQMSLEKEIARREFERTWLQEERQLSSVARQRVERRHKEAIKQLRRNLKDLKKTYKRKVSSMEDRRQRRRHDSLQSSLDSMRESQSSVLDTSNASPETGAQNQSESGEIFSEESASLEASANGAENSETATLEDVSLVFPMAALPWDPNGAPLFFAGREDPTSVEAEEPRQLLIGALDPDSSSYRSGELPVGEIRDCQYTQLRTETDGNSISSNNNGDATSQTGSVDTLWNQHVLDLPRNDSDQGVENEGPDVTSPATGNPSSSPLANTPRFRRSSRAVLKDTIFHPEEFTVAAAAAVSADSATATSGETGLAPKSPARSRRSVLRDEIFHPEGSPRAMGQASLSVSSSSADNGDMKPPAGDSGMNAKESPPRDSERALCGNPGSEFFGVTQAVNQNRKVRSAEERRSPTRSVDSGEYERQRLEAETAYYQHQAELVELELHQTEIELEQDELALQQRVQRIRLERSRLEDSFSYMQRRVEESKQEARDRQRLSAMEEKFAKYKLLRCKEEERYEQELQHLEQDDIHIHEREKCEIERQEREKLRLKKELNELVNVMNKLEHEKELSKLAEEQSSASGNNETCVVCFEPLVNEHQEIGVAVPCGHAFHENCYLDWEKSKRRRATSSVPCPLCNVGTNLCVTIRLNRPGCSLYCSPSSSLSKHFRKEERRWNRRRLIGLGRAVSSS
jgi:hypothetical protein